MKLSKVQQKLVRMALVLAIQSEESYLDAWRVAWDKRTHRPRKVIPAEERQMARKTKARIESFKKLLAAMKPSPSPPAKQKE